MIKNRKQRPPNGPGANGLRGGTNVYSSKTVVGRWMDDVGGPAAFKRGFTTKNFETEAQHQQLGATLRPPTYYGADLPVDDSNRNTKTGEWESTMQLMLKTGYVKVIERLTYFLASPIDF
jgi:hypothetical protein